MKDFSYITHSHPAYIEGLYNDYVQNPESVDPEYRKFFEGFDFAITNGTNGHAAAKTEAPAAPVAATAGQVVKELAVYSLIDAYRRKAHLVAHTNPIRPRKDRPANLEPRFFGLSDDDLQQKFVAGKAVGLEGSTLQAIIDKLKNCYAGSVGVEFQYTRHQDRIDALKGEARPFSAGEDFDYLLESIGAGGLTPSAEAVRTATADLLADRAARFYGG